MAELESMQKYRTTLIILLSFFITIQAEALSHTLQQGETLYSLSRKYGVPVSDIMRANSISSPENLSVGSKLIIPGTNSPNLNDISSSSLYIVQKGDTFYRIARNHGVSVDELFNLNHFSKGKVLKPGDELVVPKNGDSETKVEKQEQAPQITANYSDKVQWPVEGVKQTMTGKLRGVKIEAPEASLVKSIASGNVVWTGPYRGFGQVVLIDVNGYIYLYGGNEDVFVNVGEFVQAGSRIGRLGRSGLASRTVDMYFSVFKDGIPVSVVSAPRG